MQDNTLYKAMQCFAHRLLCKYQLTSKDIIFILDTLQKEIVNKEPNIININAPVYIVGGLNGNFDDFLSVFDIGGPLPYSTYLFLGNITGTKGSSLNTILLLLTYKYLYKNNVFIIQGFNEKELKTQNVDEIEVKSIPVVFKKTKLPLNKEIIQLYDLEEAKNIWSHFVTIFNNLPVACIISQIYFCTDSQFGLPDKNLSIEKIRTFDRTSYEAHGLLTQKKKEFLELNKFGTLITGLKEYQPRGGKITDHYTIFSAPHDAKLNEYCYVIEIDENRVIREIRMRPTKNKMDDLYPLLNTSILS